MCIRGEPRHHIVQNRTPFNGIDFKIPFTMSNTTAVPSITALASGEPFLFIPGYMVERIACRAPVSRSKAAPYGRAMQRWPILEACELASLIFLVPCDLVEPIGIEPMT